MPRPVVNLDEAELTNLMARPLEEAPLGTGVFAEGPDAMPEFDSLQRVRAGRSRCRESLAAGTKAWQQPGAADPASLSGAVHPHLRAFTGVASTVVLS